MASGCASAAAVRPTSIASGAAGGVYQPLAEAIARIAKESPLNLPLTVESTGASVANLQLLSEGKVAGTRPERHRLLRGGGQHPPAFRGKAASNLRAIMSIYGEYIHVVASQASGVSSVAEFRGKRVALGPAGSGTEQNALRSWRPTG